MTNFNFVNVGAFPSWHRRPDGTHDNLPCNQCADAPNKGVKHVEEVIEVTGPTGQVHEAGKVPNPTAESTGSILESALDKEIEKLERHTQAKRVADACQSLLSMALVVRDSARATDVVSKGVEKNRANPPDFACGYSADHNAEMIALTEYICTSVLPEVVRLSPSILACYDKEQAAAEAKIVSNPIELLTALLGGRRR